MAGRKKWTQGKAHEDEVLLPCPWCGKVPKVQTYAIIKTKERRFGVWCDNGNGEKCPMLAIETLPFETRNEAIAAWNKRAQ